MASLSLTPVTHLARASKARAALKGPRRSAAPARGRAPSRVYAARGFLSPRERQAAAARAEEEEARADEAPRDEGTPLGPSCFACPVCAGTLTRTVLGGGGTTLRCGASHSFDCAKEGHVNLLVRRPTSAKKLATGDTPEMLQARRRFLNKAWRVSPACTRPMLNFILLRILRMSV
jgi:hypothetical protein